MNKNLSKTMQMWICEKCKHWFFTEKRPVYCPLCQAKDLAVAGRPRIYIDFAK